MAQLPRGPPGAGRVVLSAVLLFVLAILTARLLLEGDWAWGLAALLVPVLFLVGGITVGWLLSAILVGFFAATVLLTRQLLLTESLSWSLVLFAILFLAPAAMAGRVLTALVLMRRQRKADERARVKEDGSNETPEQPAP